MSTTTHPASIHGHEVINLIHTARPALTQQQLADEVSRRFGPDARFHTCSAAEMDLQQLLGLLLFKNKIVHRDGRWYANIHNVCGHGDDHHHHDDHEH